MSAWILLLLAGLLEIAWAVGLKYTDGFSRLWPSALTIGAMVASMGLLGLATRTLPIGTAYAVWVGIGVAGTSALGVLLLGETLTPIRAGLIALLLVAVVGLKLTAD